MDLKAPGCDAGRACIDTRVFGPTTAHDYWSSSPIADNPAGAWIVGFDDGDAEVDNKPYPFAVRAVRGGL